jgi:hypothetical protein
MPVADTGGRFGHNVPLESAGSPTTEFMIIAMELQS